MFQHLKVCVDDIGSGQMGVSDPKNAIFGIDSERLDTHPGGSPGHFRGKKTMEIAAHPSCGGCTLPY